MIGREPSRTAFSAASHRAAHQLLDRGRIFPDPLAVAVLGADAGAISREAETQPSARGMRLFIASRTRFAEDTLQAGVETRGVRQLVVLGAGLDTFAYRHGIADRLRMFEVDHPATQAWKQRRLRQCAIATPATLTFVPLDFERDALAEGLEVAGLDAGQRTFFMWLGVVPYLSRDAVMGTLDYVAGLAGGAEVVFDYGNPTETLSADRRQLHEQLAARVAAAGEPFLSYFDTATLHADLAARGLTEIVDHAAPSLVARAAALPRGARFQPGGGGTEAGGHVVWAATPP